MKSIKKGALLAAALVAVIASVLPSVASAARLEMPAGTLVPKGTAFLLTSHDVHVGGYWFLGSQLETCESVVLKGQVTENSGESVKAAGTGPGTFSCRGPIYPIIHVTKFELTGLSIVRDGSGVDTASIGVRFAQVRETGASRAECTLEGTAPATYSHGASVLHVPPAPPKAIQGPCGEGTINGDFTITDAFGNPIVLN